MRTCSKGWTHDGVNVETGKRGRTHIVNLAADHDVVVSHFGDGGVGATVARKSGRPSVQMVHGHIHKGPASADLLVFNSNASRDQCPHTAPSIVCPPPVRPEDHRVDVRGDAVTIVNCTDAKGIRTAWRVAEALPHLPFLGVRGGYGYQIEPRAKNFEVLATQVDMRPVWARTRVLLMPSEHETWGMAGVEAMCSGIPVIAHPTDGLLESLGPAGIFVDRDDIDGWVAALERLDDPVEYGAASARAYARAAELDPMVSLERFTRALEGLIA
jgi:hypothetical protein